MWVTDPHAEALQWMHNVPLSQSSDLGGGLRTLQMKDLGRKGTLPASRSPTPAPACLILEKHRPAGLGVQSSLLSCPISAPGEPVWCCHLLISPLLHSFLHYSGDRSPRSPSHLIPHCSPCPPQRQLANYNFDFKSWPVDFHWEEPSSR